MKTSDRGIQLIKLFEGMSLKAYKCPANVWTIGFGHTRTAKEGMVITEAEAIELLRQDLTRFENYIRREFPNITDQDQFDALISFVYNLGSIKGTVRAGLVNNDIERVIFGLSLYTKGGGKYLLGLHRRRLAEATLFAGIRLQSQELEAIRYKYKTADLERQFKELMQYAKDKKK